jgi:hypothetical protein
VPSATEKEELQQTGEASFLCCTTSFEALFLPRLQKRKENVSLYEENCVILRAVNHNLKAESRK